MDVKTFDEIASSFGFHDNEKKMTLLNKHSSQLAGALSANGTPLLLCALQQDDASAVAHLLECGCNPDQQAWSGAKVSVLQEVRESLKPDGLAMKTLESFLALKRSASVDFLPVKAMSPAWNDEEGLEKHKALIYDKIKNTPEEGMVTLYHASGGLGDLASHGSSENLLKTQREGILQRTTVPTLSTYPLMGYCRGGLCWEIQVPRSLVELPGEHKPNALVGMPEGGDVALIYKDHKGDCLLSFDKVKGKPHVAPTFRTRALSHDFEDDLGRSRSEIEYEVLGENAREVLLELKSISQEQGLKIDATAQHEKALRSIGGLNGIQSKFSEWKNNRVAVNDEALHNSANLRSAPKP
jgi:hypothetical protein